MLLAHLCQHCDMNNVARCYPHVIKVGITVAPISSCCLSQFKKGSCQSNSLLFYEWREQAEIVRICTAYFPVDELCKWALPLAHLKFYKTAAVFLSLQSSNFWVYMHKWESARFLLNAVACVSVFASYHLQNSTSQQWLWVDHKAQSSFIFAYS